MKTTWRHARRLNGMARGALRAAAGDMRALAMLRHALRAGSMNSRRGLYERKRSRRWRDDGRRGHDGIARASAWRRQARFKGGARVTRRGGAACCASGIDNGMF